MYDFVLKPNEIIKFINDTSILMIDEVMHKVVTIVTDKRLLILDYPRDDESFRFGVIINQVNKMEIIFEKEIDDLIDIEEIDNYFKYIFTDTNYICLCDKNLDDFINNNVV